ncbi:hypothetical protein GGI11_008224, partial [Coemansia sp. RSA 2049]
HASSKDTRRLAINTQTCNCSRINRSFEHYARHLSFSCCACSAANSIQRSVVSHINTTADTNKANCPSSEPPAATTAEAKAEEPLTAVKDDPKDYPVLDGTPQAGIGKAPEPEDVITSEANERVVVAESSN